MKTHEAAPGAPEVRDEPDEQSGPLVRRSAERHASQRSAPSASTRATRLPARYGVLVLAGGLLMFASAASVPLGPAANSVARELLTFAAGALGLLLALAACLPTPGVTAWIQRRVWAANALLVLAVGLALATLVTFAGSADVILRAPAAEFYSTDIVSFTHVNAQLAATGQNPYTSDAAFRDALAQFPFVYGTPLRGTTFGTGEAQPAPDRIAAVQRQYVSSPASVRDAFDPRTLHSYPALSFLVYVPFFWLGGTNILALNVLVYWGLFAWLVWLTPVGWRHWGALVALAATSTVVASLVVGDEVICVALLLAAWHWRSHLVRSAVLLGLACAYKQYAWFFVPFFAVAVCKQAGIRETVKYGAVALVAFLLPNLPYLIASPQPWFTSLWLPMSEPLFASGMGLIALPIGHVIPFTPPAAYAALELLVLGALLWAGWRWRSRLGEALIVLPLVPLFFAYRSLPTYFAFAPWLALYAANRQYALEGIQGAVPAPIERWVAQLVRSLHARESGRQTGFAACSAVWRMAVTSARRLGHLTDTTASAATVLSDCVCGFYSMSSLSIQVRPSSPATTRPPVLPRCWLVHWRHTSQDDELLPP